MCKIYVDEQHIYEGSFEEVPDKFRRNIVRDLTQWAELLGKGGINELIYSHLAWYLQKDFVCQNCSGDSSGVSQNQSQVESERCQECGGFLNERFQYERNEKLDLIMTCVGTISRVEVLG